MLRREILSALHALTGTMEPWREVGIVMRRYLGPWVGMSATERWETMGPHELELLADALLEREAIVWANRARGRVHVGVARAQREHRRALPGQADAGRVTEGIQQAACHVPDDERREPH